MPRSRPLTVSQYLVPPVRDLQWSQQDKTLAQESDATFPTQFDVLQVSSRNIRFVHLPADIDIVKALEYQVILSQLHRVLVNLSPYFLAGAISSKGPPDVSAWYT